MKIKNTTILTIFIGLAILITGSITIGETIINGDVTIVPFATSSEPTASTTTVTDDVTSVTSVTSTTTVSESIKSVTTVTNTTTLKIKQQAALKNIDASINEVGKEIKLLETKKFTPRVERQIHQLGELGLELSTQKRRIQRANTSEEIEAILQIIEKRKRVYEEFNRR